jgi:hypothetical protein
LEERVDHDQVPAEGERPGLQGREGGQGS